MRHPRTAAIEILILGALLALLAGCTSGDSEQADSADSAASADADDDAEATTTTGEVAPPDLITVDQIPGDEPTVDRSALDDMFDPSFPEPLVDPDEILSGGPPPDGIPPIDDPQFERASEIDWLDDVEPILTIDVNGETRGYPVQVMIWHELVNDTFDDVPVTVSYCPLCNSAIAYDRRVDGRILDFGTSGRLYNSSLVMYDRQTESLWLHFTGQATVGELTGTEIERLPVSTVSWKTFREAEPDALVLSRFTGFDRNYGENPYPGLDDVNASPLLYRDEVDDRLPAQARVLSIRGETESVVVSLEDLSEAGTVTLDVDDQPVVVLHEPGQASALNAPVIRLGTDVGTTGVFRPEFEGQALDLRADGNGLYVDEATGLTVDILGTIVSGGEGQLEPVEHLDTFWFAIAAFEPDTEIIEP